VIVVAPVIAANAAGVKTVNRTERNVVGSKKTALRERSDFVSVQSGAPGVRVVDPSTPLILVSIGPRLFQTVALSSVYENKLLFFWSAAMCTL